MVLCVASIDRPPDTNQVRVGNFYTRRTFPKFQVFFFHSVRIQNKL